MNKLLWNLTSLEAAALNDLIAFGSIKVIADQQKVSIRTIATRLDRAKIKSNQDNKYKMCILWAEHNKKKKPSLLDVPTFTFNRK